MQEEPISKTRKKKDMLALQELGAKLVELNAQQLESMHLPPSLLEAVLEARQLSKHEARRRQMQYIGRLMRGIDAAPIREKLEQWQGLDRERKVQLHAIERWRDELLAAEPALARFLEAHPGADGQRLRVLIRNARRELDASLPPKNYRELFRILRDTMEKEAGADV